MIPDALVLLGLSIVGGGVAGIVALVLVLKWRDEVRNLQQMNRTLETRVARLESLGRTVGIRDREPERAKIREPEVQAPVLAPAERPPVEQVEPLRSGEPETPPLEPPRKPVPERAKPSRDLHQRDQQWWAGLEERAGKRWMTWAGALVLFLSVGFFLKHAFENQWLGPTGRVVLGIVAGIVMLIAGDHCLRKRMRPLGQGLIGGALAILYVSLFAAFSLYKLLPQAATMAGLVTVTAAGVAMAVIHDAIPLSFLAVLGGFIAPLLVSTGRDPRDALFSYVTLLDLGVLGVAFFKRWRALDILAFAGTWVLFSGWYVHFHRDFALIPTLMWIAVFFLIFLIVPFVHPLRTRIDATLESFTLAMANAVMTFGYAYAILRVEHRVVLGFLALGMCACYLLMGYLFRTRVEDDKRSVFGFVALSVVFLTLAVPLHMRVHGITLAWAAEGPALLYLGYVYRYRPVRIAGALVLLLAVIRLFTAHWPLHVTLYIPFLNRQFAAAAFVPLATAVYAAIHFWRKDENTDRDRYLMIGSALAAGFVTILITHGEVVQWLRYKADDFGADGRYLSFTAGAFIWTMGTLGFLGASLIAKSRPAYFACLGALSVGLTLWLFAYASAMNWGYYLFLNVRFLTGLCLASAVGACAYVAYGYGEILSEEDRQLAYILSALAGALLLILLSAETYAYCIENIPNRTRARWTAQMSLTIVWGLFAVTALVIGFHQQVRPLRFAALSLLAVAAAKLVLVDMAQVAQIYRIVSFVVLGMLMIAASFLYHRLETSLVKPSGESG
jgi:uncharacterized membrane protein